MSANDKVADGIRAHSIDLERFSADMRNRILPILNRVEKSLADDVSKIDPTGTARITNRQARLKLLLTQTQGTIATAYGEIADQVQDDLREVAKVSDKAARAIPNKVLGVDIMTVALAPEQLRALADNTIIEGAPVREHWKRQETALVQKFQDRVQDGYIRGESSTDIIRRVRGTAAMNYADGIVIGQKHQAATLVRTSVQAVSNSARLESVKANSDILAGVQFLATMDNKTSIPCVARSGLTWDLDGNPTGGHSIPFRSPPIHMNCLPGDALVTPCGGVTSASKRHFDGYLIVIRTATGLNLSCTPNHPVLTNRGWVAAQFINQGDRVVCNLGSEFPSATINGEHDQVPARIEDIANSFLGSSEVVSAPVISSAEDFHGDGVDGEVAIVGTDRFLRLHDEAPLPEQGVGLSLVAGDVIGGNLPRDGSLDLRLHPVSLAAPGTLSRGGESASLFRRGAVHSGLLLLPTVPQGDSGFSQDSLYGTWTDVEFLRDASDTNSAGVKLDDVVAVEKRPFSGHVYNLETETSLYIANGIVNHNCRSTLVSVLRPWSEVSSKADIALPNGALGTLPDFVRAKLSKAKADSVIDAMQASMHGPVAANLDYESWLKKQSVEFQMDVLGPGKHALWTANKITFRDLVDQTGNPLTLAELTAKVESGQTVVAKAEKLAAASAAVAAVNDLKAIAAAAETAVRDQVKASIKAGYVTPAQGTLLKEYSAAKVEGTDPTISQLDAYDKLPDWFKSKIVTAIDARRAALRAENQAGPDFDYVQRKAVAESAQKLKGTLHKPDQTAVWLPGQTTDGTLHGVPFEPWEPGLDFDWNKAAGKNASIIEPPMPQVAGKKTSSGVIIVEDDGRIWIYEPTNHFGGYQHTFPKGTLESGLDLQATAIKEAWEESGLQVEILSHLGDYEKSTSVTRYYIAKRTGGAPWQMGWESQNVKLVPQNQLPGFLNVDTDKTIAHDAIAAYQKAMVAGNGNLKAGIDKLNADAKALAAKAAKAKSNAISEWVAKTAQGKIPPPSAQKVFDTLSPDEQAAYAAKAAAKKADIDAGAELADIRAGQHFIPNQTYREAAAESGSGWAKKTPNAKLQAVQKLHNEKIEAAAKKAQAEAESAAAAKAAADAQAMADVEPLYQKVSFQLAMGKNNKPDELKAMMARAEDKPALAAQWKAIDAAENAADDIIYQNYMSARPDTPAWQAYEAVVNEPGVFELPMTKLLRKLDAKTNQIIEQQAAAAKVAQEAAEKAAQEAAQAAAKAENRAFDTFNETFYDAEPGSNVDLAFKFVAPDIDAGKPFGEVLPKAQAKLAELDAQQIVSLQAKAKPLDVLQAEAQAAIDAYVTGQIKNPANQPKAAKGLQAWIDNQVSGGTAQTGMAHMAAIEKSNPAGAEAIKAFVEAKKAALSGITPGAAPDPAVSRVVVGIDGAKAKLDGLVDAYILETYPNSANYYGPAVKAGVSDYVDDMVAGKKPNSTDKFTVDQLPAAAQAAVNDYIAAKKGGAPLAVPDVPSPPAVTEDAPAPKAKKTPKPKTAKKVKPAPGEPDPVAKTLIATDAPKFANLTQTGPQGGSNLGGFFTDTTTNKVYYVKAPTNEDIARNEVLAAKLYELAGVAGPKLHGIDIDGTVSGRQFKGFGIASELLEGQIVEGPAALKSAADMRENFAVDAWLANWDITGPDFKNTVVIGGKAVRLDVGGALRYRAQGALKPNFNAEITELETLLDPGINSATARVFGGMTKAELETGVSRVLSIPDSDIRAMVAEHGPREAAASEKLAETLIARKKWLAAKYPHLAKADQPKAPVPAAVTGKVTPIEMKTVVEARSNGYVRLTDKDMIEDQHVQLWVEKSPRGNLSHAGAALKLRNAGADLLEAAIKGATDKAETTPAIGPRKADPATLDSAIVIAIKGIASRAAKGLPLEAKDVERAAAAAKAYSAFLKKMADLDYPAADIAAARAHYGPWIEELESAVSRGPGKTAAWKPTKTPPGLFTGHVVPPAPVKAAAPKPVAPVTDEIVWTKKGGVYEAKVTDKGWLTRTGNPLTFKAKAGTKYEHYYEAEIDGVTVRYWSNEPEIAMALRGKLELSVEGTDAAAAEKMIGVMDRLGIDTERPDPLDLEHRYLQQIAFNRKHKFPPSILNKPTLKAKVDAMHDHLSKAAGYTLRQSPHWNPEGVRNAFGHSRPFALRPDMDTPATEDFVRTHGFNHMAGGNGLLTMFKTIMNEGGFFAPKADFFRRGKDFTAFGMSPTADMTAGGGAYVYTRVQPRTHGGAGLFWDGSLARRVDARTHKSDPIGKLLPEGQRIQADGTAEQFDKMKGTYETIFKNGISLFEHRFQLRVESQSDKMEAINWLKSQGEPYAGGLWPDGRSLEEVIVIARTAT